MCNSASVYPNNKTAIAPHDKLKYISLSYIVAGMAGRLSHSVCQPTKNTKKNIIILYEVIIKQQITII